MPVLFDGSLSDAELQLFVLPTRLGVLDLTSMATEIFKTSKKGAVVVANASKGKDTLYHVSHLDAINEARQMHRKVTPVQLGVHSSKVHTCMNKTFNTKGNKSFLQRVTLESANLAV